MAQNLWVGALGKGLAADRPGTPDFPADTVGFYYETDTGNLALGQAGSDDWDSNYIGSASVTSPTTADTVSPGGTSVFSGTAAKAYNLAAPVPGVRKVLACTHVSTVAKTITLESGNIVSTAQSTIQSIAFIGLGQSVTLEGLSTANYIITGVTGAPTIA